MSDCHNCRKETEGTVRMPYMGPMIYYGTYPVPVTEAMWNGGFPASAWQAPYGAVPPMPYAGYYGIPFPENQP